MTARGLGSAHNDRAVGVVHDVAADTAHEHAVKFAMATVANDDHVCSFFLGNINNGHPSFATPCNEFGGNLGRDMCRNDKKIVQAWLHVLIYRQISTVFLVSKY